MTDTILPHSVVTAGNFTVFTLQVLPILLVIPVCELVIYPLMQNYKPTILKKIGIGMTMIIISIIVSLVLYVTLHSMQVTPNDHHCFWFNSTANRNETLPAPIIAVPFTISSLSALLVYIAG